jgi:hypothetical protein
VLLLVLIFVLAAFGLLLVALVTGTAAWAWISVVVSVAAAGVLVYDWAQRRAAVRSGNDRPAMPRPPMMPMLRPHEEPPTTAIPVQGHNTEPATEVFPALRPAYPASPSGAGPVGPAVGAMPSGSSGRPPGAEPDAGNLAESPSHSVTSAGSSTPKESERSISAPTGDTGEAKSPPELGKPIAASASGWESFAAASAVERESDSKRPTAPAADVPPVAPKGDAGGPATGQGSSSGSDEYSKWQPRETREPGAGKATPSAVGQGGFGQSGSERAKTADAERQSPAPAASVAPSGSAGSDGPTGPKPPAGTSSAGTSSAPAKQSGAPAERQPATPASGPSVAGKSTGPAVGPSEAKPDGAKERPADTAAGAPAAPSEPTRPAARDSERTTAISTAALAGAAAGFSAAAAKSSGPAEQGAKTPPPVPEPDGDRTTALPVLSGGQRPARAPEQSKPGSGHTPDATQAISPVQQGGADPAEEKPDAAALATVSTLTDEVLVIDEHPRFHLAGCRVLAGNDTIPLPAKEAVEYGFSPCSVCSPVRVLAGRNRAASSS